MVQGWRLAVDKAENDMFIAEEIAVSPRRRSFPLIDVERHNVRDQDT